MDIKKLFRRIKVKLQPEAAYDILDYYNGPCPNCGQHIGTDIRMNVLTLRRSAICGACGANVYVDIQKQQKGGCGCGKSTS